MKKLILTSLFVLLALTSWAQSTELRGSVVDAKTQKPLVNVTANVTNTNLSATTNAEGEFVILNPTPGAQTLLVDLTG